MNQELLIQEGFHIIKLKNTTSETIRYFKDADRSFIQIHFCVEDEMQLHFGNNYSLAVNKNKSLFLYNPKQNLPVNLDLNPNATCLVLLVTIKVFHSFFSQVADLIHFLNEENRDKKYYSDKILTPSEIVVLNQVFDEQVHSSLQKLYTKAKSYELLSLYFNKKENDAHRCPFLDSKDNVEKIKKAKQIMIANMAEPPSLQELADEIALPLSKLKEGFKHIYGESVFNFLLGYKMEYARRLLLSKKYNVSEISLQIGYSTASHFIAAFRKKYGTTPKQYVMNVS